MTLIELFFVLGIVGVLLALAMPRFDSTLRQFRTRQARDALVDTVQWARAEALRRGSVIGVVPRTCPQADWGCGWEVFVDTDGNGAVSTTEEVVRRQEALSGVVIPLEAAKPRITIRADGRRGDKAQEKFQVFPIGGNAQDRACRQVTVGLGPSLQQVDTCS